MSKNNACVTLVNCQDKKYALLYYRSNLILVYDFKLKKPFFCTGFDKIHEKIINDFFSVLNLPFKAYSTPDKLILNIKNTSTNEIIDVTSPRVAKLNKLIKSISSYSFPYFGTEDFTLATFDKIQEMKKKTPEPEIEECPDWNEELFRGLY